MEGARSELCGREEGGRGREADRGKAGEELGEGFSVGVAVDVDVVSVRRVGEGETDGVRVGDGGSGRERGERIEVGGCGGGDGRRGRGREEGVIRERWTEEWEGREVEEEEVVWGKGIRVVKRRRRSGRWSEGRPVACWSEFGAATPAFKERANTNEKLEEEGLVELGGRELREEVGEGVSVMEGGVEVRRA